MEPVDLRLLFLMVWWRFLGWDLIPYVVWTNLFLLHEYIFSAYTWAFSVCSLCHAFMDVSALGHRDICMPASTQI